MNNKLKRAKALLARAEKMDYEGNRPRKVRRAQAKVDNINWRELNPIEKLML